MKNSQYSAMPAYAYPQARDEVSILEIFRALVARRRLIGGTVIVFVALALLYVVIARPVYQAEAFVKPPQLLDVDVRDKSGASLSSLDVGASLLSLDVGANTVSLDAGASRRLLDIRELDPNAVFHEFLSNLRSRSIRREFFDERNLVAVYAKNRELRKSEAYEIFEEFFNTQLLVDAPDDSSSVRISYKFVNPERATTLLNEFIEMVDRRTIARLLYGIEADVRNRTKSLRGAISRKVRLVQTLQNDQIERLIEASNVAAAMNLKERFVTSAPGDTVAPTSQPLYLRGVEALQSEIAVLKARKSIEPFTEGLRELQSELALLEAIEIDDSNLRAAAVDQAAVASSDAVKPQRLLTLVLSVLLGLFLGGFVALAASAVEKQREKSPG